MRRLREIHVLSLALDLEFRRVILVLRFLRLLLGDDVRFPKLFRSVALGARHFRSRLPVLEVGFRASRLGCSSVSIGSELPVVELGEKLASLYKRTGFYENLSHHSVALSCEFDLVFHHERPGSDVVRRRSLWLTRCLGGGFCR